ncbi:ankyrin repeat protein [Colletotrichum kahawae]|uniref:Ankyrin repeat protein n=1 Tax=Colletotrichum kahawae TaxID=34407 RepID=A0AAE0D213_COLKA|nr:ankyrin repeat protein [Colletotrichum kahawae]
MLLSRYNFVPEDEVHARRLLEAVSSDETENISGIVIGFFRSKLAGPQSISQLLITAIKTKSNLVWDLITEYAAYVDSTNGLLETPLTVAACGYDLALCQRLVQLGACLEPTMPRSAFNDSAATPLQCAAFFSDAAMIRCLLDLGAKINFCHPLTHDPEPRPICVHGSRSQQFYKRINGNGYLSCGRTALQAALLGRKRENIQLLLSEGATQIGGELDIACRTGQHSCVRDLLYTVPGFRSYAALPVNDSVIHAAVLNRDFQLASYMFNCRQRVIPGQLACAAVLVARRTLDLHATRNLLAAITKPPPEDDFWLGTAMSLAAELGIPQIADMIMDFGLRPETSAPAIIHVASQIGKCDYLDILVRHNFPASSVCGSIAIASGRDVCDFLRRLGDLGVAMTTVMLAIAIEKKAFDVVEWLVHQDIDYEEKPDDLEDYTPLEFDDSDHSPLQAAVRGGHREIMERLLYLGANVNDEPCWDLGATALQVAAMEGYAVILRRLLELKADPNAPGAVFWGRTALEGAAEHGRLEAVQILLSSGAETLGSGRRQYIRAIAYARLYGHHAVAELLESHRELEEADQKILNEKDLLHENQRPEKIAERQRVSSESGNGVEGSIEAVSLDPGTKFCEDGHWIQEEPGPLTGGLEPMMLSRKPRGCHLMSKSDTRLSINKRLPEKPAQVSKATSSTYCYAIRRCRNP